MNNLCATVLAVLLSAKYSVILGAEDKIVKLGETIVLGCITDANSIIWSYRNNSIDESITLMEKSAVNPEYTNKLTFVDKHCLQIINFSSQDEGIYSCYKLKQKSSIHLNLQIEAAPENLIILSNTTDGIIIEKEGQILNITCQVLGGNTKGKIYWSNVSEFKPHFTEIDEWPFAQINFTTDYEHHKMNLSCVVEHDLLAAQLVASVILNVLYKPRITVSRYPAGDIKEGQNLTLECLDESNPPKANTTWVKDGIILSSDPIYEKTNIKTKDSGNYSCIVFNSLGKEEEDIVILVMKDNDTHINENADISFEIPLEFVMVYTLVCTCGTILFCSASYCLPLCRKEKFLTK